MNAVTPPRPDAVVTLQVKGMPVRLWWKLMETAQQQGVSINYLVFKTLVEAVGFNDEGESYDMVVKEIEQQLCAPDSDEA